MPTTNSHKNPQCGCGFESQKLKWKKHVWSNFDFKQVKVSFKQVHRLQASATSWPPESAVQHDVSGQSQTWCPTCARLDWVLEKWWAKSIASMLPTHCSHMRSSIALAGLVLSSTQGYVADSRTFSMLSPDSVMSIVWAQHETALICEERSGEFANVGLLWSGVGL